MAVNTLKPWGILVALALVLANGTTANAHTIEKKPSAPDLYTTEVTDVRCQGNRLPFRSKGLPHPSHPMMTGIEATNQQFPSVHDYEFEIDTAPRLESRTTPTQAGPIGVAVNGIPLFDPSTQGPRQRNTGKRPHTLDAGELDECGGHAGRGDDYHYHIAPKCLIEQLGADHVEARKRPIGFAADGFPILALGWFEPANDAERLLDACRGTTNDTGADFYNVMHAPKWDILNCFHGRGKGFARDRWRHRKDRTGAEIVG